MNLAVHLTFIGLKIAKTVRWGKLSLKFKKAHNTTHNVVEPCLDHQNSPNFLKRGSRECVGWRIASMPSSLCINHKCENCINFALVVGSPSRSPKTTVTPRFFGV